MYWDMGNIASFKEHNKIRVKMDIFYKQTAQIYVNGNDEI
jgi:hypothetical protein